MLALLLLRSVMQALSGLTGPMTSSNRNLASAGLTGGRTCDPGTFWSTCPIRLCKLATAGFTGTQVCDAGPLGS